MSLESWKQEYYPIPANEVSKADAAKHSLQKWIGLRVVNRINHAVQLDYGELKDNDVDHESCDYDSLDIDSSSCALCVHHLKETDLAVTCTGCPLAAALGRPCDTPGAPYNSFLGTGNVEPMIKELQCLCSNSAEPTQAATPEAG